MNSPYDNAIILNFPDGDVVLESAQPRPREASVIHTVKPGQTLQNISYAYYGDSGYWAYLAYANKIINPFTEVKAGMKLIIPKV